MKWLEFGRPIVRNELNKGFDETIPLGENALRAKLTENEVEQNNAQNHSVKIIHNGNSTKMNYPKP